MDYSSLWVQVTAVPTLMGVRGGGVRSRLVGDQKQELVEEFVSKLLSDGS